MSFAVSLAGRSFEWSSNGLDALFATRSNLLSADFRSMIADMLRFNQCVGGLRAGAEGRELDASESPPRHSL
jgi:predicted NAD/FAD-binding protein